MKLRSTISLFLCAALAAAFVGCGASDASASKPDAGPAAAFRAAFDAMIAGNFDAYAASTTKEYKEKYVVGPPRLWILEVASHIRADGVSFTVGEVLREMGNTATVRVTIRSRKERRTEYYTGIARKVDGVWKVDDMDEFFCISEFDPIANNGKEIVMAIRSANSDRVASMRGEVWPNKGKWQDSNAYFAKLMGDGGRSPILERIPFRVFADGGVTIATDAEELKRKGNVWTMLAGIGRCPDSRTPFLWTRNLRLTQADLEAYARNPDAERSLAARLDPLVEPFGTDCVVMITKGGAVFEIKAPKLTAKAFFGGVELDPSAVEIVEALPD